MSEVFDMIVKTYKIFDEIEEVTKDQRLTVLIDHKFGFEPEIIPILAEDIEYINEMEITSEKDYIEYLNNIIQGEVEYFLETLSDEEYKNSNIIEKIAKINKALGGEEIDIKIIHKTNKKIGEKYEEHLNTRIYTAINLAIVEDENKKVNAYPLDKILIGF